MTDAPALVAARALCTEGHHVHYLADGQARCLSGHCAHQETDPR
ncbi:hypothetical protein [Streptomyces chryseus]